MHALLYLIYDTFRPGIWKTRHFVVPSTTTYGHHSFHIDQIQIFNICLVVQVYKGEIIFKRNKHLNEGILRVNN